MKERTIELDGGYKAKGTFKRSMLEKLAIELGMTLQEMYIKLGFG
jgi:hypothetical protein